MRNPKTLPKKESRGHRLKTKPEGNSPTPSRKCGVRGLSAEEAGVVGSVYCARRGEHSEDKSRIKGVSVCFNR
jgi:hypothetical protein